MAETLFDAEAEAAWNLARPIAGRDPAVYRIAPDVIQSVIRRDRYNVRGEFGWRIEYGRPVAYWEITIGSAIRQLQRNGVTANGRHMRAGPARQSQG